MTVIGHELSGDSGIAGGDGLRPGYWRLVGATFGALLVTGIVLIAPIFVLSMLKLFPYQNGSPLKPFDVDSVWSLIAAGAWAATLGALVATQMLRFRSLREWPLPSRGWMTVAVTIGVYGSSLLHVSTGVKFLLMLTLTPLLIGQIAYRQDGHVKRWPLSRRANVVLACGAVLMTLGFGATHPFVSTGGGGVSETSTTFSGFSFALRGALIPARIQSATVAVRENGWPTQLRASVSTGSDFGLAGTILALPHSFRSGTDIWVSVGAGSGISCHAGQTFTISSIKLRYTMLGLPAATTVPVPTTIFRCPV